MAEFRTASGIVSCDVFMRTAGGLVQVDPQFRNGGGLVDCASSPSFAVDYSIGPQSFSPLASTGNYVGRRALTAVVTGGTAPFTYLYAIEAESGPGAAILQNATNIAATVQTTSFADEPGSGADVVSIGLTVTDAASRVATITHDVQMESAT